MKKIQLVNNTIVIIGFMGLIISSCTDGGSRDGSTSTVTQEKEVICPKNLSYSECPNSPALHGQIMVHNMTNKSYEVEVEHHENIFDSKRITPGDGWTFVGVIQGKRLLIAKPSTGGDTFESNCTVIGNTQHMMNIMPYGFVMIDPKGHSGHAQEKEDSSEIIHIPIRKETGH